MKNTERTTVMVDESYCHATSADWRQLREARERYLSKPTDGNRDALRAALRKVKGESRS